EKGVLPVYKIHGCLKNPVTQEDTRESIVTTLDALGKSKEGQLFSIEPYKIPFFKTVTHERTLVIMGYSGGDDFDIVPTLLQLQNLKRVVWISHTPDESIDTKTYRFTPPKFDFNLVELEELENEDQILYRLSLSAGVEVIKVIAHTSSLITSQINTSITPESQAVLAPLQWISENIRTPEDGEKEYFAGRIFLEYAYYKDAIHYLKRAYATSKKRSNFKIMARAAVNLGLAFMNIGKPRKALQYCLEGYQLHEQVKDPESMIIDLNNIAIIHMNARNPQLALKYLQKAYDEAKSHKNLRGLGQTIGNIGLVHKETGGLKEALANFQKAYDLFEQTGNLREMAIDLENIGLIYKELEEWQKASEYYQKAYRINEQIGALEAITANLSKMGNLYELQENREKALEYHQKTYELDKRLGNREGMNIDSQNIRNICFTIFDLIRKELEKLQNSLEHGAVYLDSISDRMRLKSLTDKILAGLTFLDSPIGGINLRMTKIYTEISHSPIRGMTIVEGKSLVKNLLKRLRNFIEDQEKRLINQDPLIIQQNLSLIEDLKSIEKKLRELLKPLKQLSQKELQKRIPGLKKLLDEHPRPITRPVPMARRFPEDL
ncbi:MAG: tetratricopeptide repeat protein, partial [Candidatus Hodarchaeota archaeon]